MWVDHLAGALARRTSRRGFLARTAVVGAALAADPVNYVLRPASAYSSVCGDGASCSSGWTAFCVTVNKGVNQCPPGSFAAGWWKADHASVCGGRARYYVDCNASCIHGQPGHYSCHCRCAPGTTCDKRRTCCNQFRYGQCHQEVHCYGPVVCRVVSCVPPWVWAHCSKSAATDNRTLTHSAPDLPHHYDAVEARYVALHGHASPLGASVGPRQSLAGGLMQNYQHGLIAWSPHTIAAMLRATAVGYLHTGGPAGSYGFPTHDERPTTDGLARLGLLQHGCVYAGGGIVVHTPAGAWLPRWIWLCDHSSNVGRPTSHMIASVGQGHVGAFQHGALFSAAATGVRLVSGDCYTHYVSLGRESSPLGYPTSDTASTPDNRGTWTSYADGVIVSRPDIGTWEILGAVYGYWRDSGSFSSPLGYPTSAQQATSKPDAGVAHFEHGDVYTSASLGTHAVLPPLLDVYVQNNRDSGPLGLPIGDATTSGSLTVQQFEGGSITYDAGTGTTTVTLSTPSSGTG